MNVDQYLHAIRSETALLAAAARAAGPDAALPSCPDWVMRDVIHHLGEVQRWSAAVVRDSVSNPSELAQDFLGSLPDDDALIDWLDAGAGALVTALRDADRDLACFTFLENSPPPRVFWARRQAHEVGMHRVDAELALGRNTGFTADIATDGIDELLTGFAPRKRTPLRSDVPRRLLIAPDDSPSAWGVTIGEHPVVTDRLTAADAIASMADCSVSGSSSNIYEALWNRRDTEGFCIDGDAAVLNLFRSAVQIRWS